MFKAVHRPWIFGRLLIVLGFLITISIFSCKTSPQNPPLAKFKGGAVLQSEYVDHFLASTLYKPDFIPTEENLREIVHRKAMEKMAVAEALAKNLDKDSTYQVALQNQSRKIVFYKYMQQEIMSQVITDSLIKEFYDHFSPQYNMKYIIRPVVKTSTPEFERAQKDTIEFVHRLLRSGKKFEDLANKYSQDITTNQKGGDLGFVIRESLGDERIRAVMDTLKDFSFSRPFRGYEGYYILYKGEKRIVPVPPFEQVRDKIWQTLYRTRRHNIQQQVNIRFQALVEKYAYRLDDDVKKQILGKAGADELTPVYTLLDFSVLTDDEMSLPLAVYDGGTIKVAELFANRRREPQSLVDFEERFSAIAEEHLLGKHAFELGIQNDPAITMQIDLIKASLLRNSLMQLTVREIAKVRVDSLKKALENTVPPEELKSIVSKRTLEFEKELQRQFEEKMKRKYRFKYFAKNFASALDEARVMKQEQNSKMSAKDTPGNLTR